ncbi:MAG: carboxypeptidase regulatory-like domain-containing protein [Vicinamibacterales bacterium]
MKRLGRLVLTLLLMMGSSAAVFGQGGSASTTGTIAGRVTDAQNAVLPGVTVSIQSPALMGVQTTVTNDQGIYRFPAVPPGVYAISYELAGFNGLRREGIQISLGFTATLNVELQVATVQESVTVTGESPVIDTSATRIQQNFKLDDLRSIPNARDMWSLLAVTPSVQMQRIDVGGNRAGTQTNYTAYGFGATDQQVRVSVEGINTTEGTGGAGFYFDYGSFEEVFLGTTGQGAEAATPGVQSQFLGKSGGNKLQGGVYLDWYNNTLQGSNLPDNYIKPTSEGGFGIRKGSNEIENYRDFNLNGGGPIKKDRIWWYGSWRWQANAVQQPNFLFDKTFDTALWNLSGKSTYQLNRNHKFIGYYQWGQKVQPNRLWNGGYSFLKPEDTRKQDSGSWVWKGEWNGTLSNNLFVETRFGDFGYYFPLLGYSDEPFRQDTGTRISTGGDLIEQTDRDRHQLTGAATYFKDDFLGGSHSFKFGGEANFEKQFIGYQQIRAQNIEQIFANGVANQVIIGFPTVDGPIGTKSARKHLLSVSGLQHFNFFTNDQYSVGRLTFNLGVRFDHYRSYIPAQQQLASTTAGFSIPAIDFPEQTFFTWNSVVPRIGAVYDMKGNGKTVLKANYGYFRHNPGPGAAANANPNQAQKDRTYTWTDLNGDRLFQFGEQGSLVRDRSQPAGTQVDPNILQPYTHELSAFVEQQITTDLGMRAGYVYKTVDDLTQVYQPFRPISAYTVPFTVADIGPDKTAGTSDDRALTFYGIPNASLGAATQRLQNVDAQGRYSTIEVSVNKRHSGKWSAGTGFNYTRAKEFNNSILGNSLTAANQAPGFPNTANDAGQQSSTSWGFRAYGSYEAPWGVRLSPVLRHQSGQNYGRTITVSAPASCQCFYPGGSVLIEPLDSRRMDNVTVFDIRVERPVKLSGGARLGLFLDVFNLSNSHSSETISFATGSAFERPTAVLAPATARVGIRFDF